MIYEASFDPADIIQPEDLRTQYYPEQPSPLPQDGLPRITAEGMEILLEGMRGDFHRWRWSIGNHPFQLPYEHARNILINAMKERPHFIARFWYGPDYPQVKYRVLTPAYSFDRVDTLTIGEDPVESIHLRQAADYWNHVPVQIGDYSIWTEADRNRFKTAAPLDVDEPEEEPPRSGCTLDAWMEGDA